MCELECVYVCVCVCVCMCVCVYVYVCVCVHTDQQTQHSHKLFIGNYELPNCLKKMEVVVLFFKLNSSFFLSACAPFILMGSTTVKTCYSVLL